MPQIRAFAYNGLWFYKRANGSYLIFIPTEMKSVIFTGDQFRCGYSAHIHQKPVHMSCLL